MTIEYSAAAEEKVGRSAISQIRQDIDSGQPERNFRWEIFSRRLIEHFKTAKVFVDCGAEWGFYVYLAVKHGNPDLTIHAFEPDPTRCAALLREYGDFPRVHIHPYAVGEASRTITLNKPKKAGASATIDSQNSQLGAQIEMEPFAVEQVALDEFLDPSTVDAVKMDIEGAELFALFGMRKILAAGKAHIYAELHPRYIAALRPDGMKDIGALMSDCGYSFTDINGRPIPLEQGRGIFRPTPPSSPATAQS